MKTIVENSAGYFLVSTVVLPVQMRGALLCETMVFPCDCEGNVEDWSELDGQQYLSPYDAMKGHTEMVKEWTEM